MKIIVNIFFFLTISNLVSFGQPLKSIAPNDSRIHLSGTKYSKISEEMIEFRRHSDSVLALPITESLFNAEKAKTTSGIVISFISESPEIVLHFRKLPGTQRTGSFGIKQNGEFTGSFKLRYNADTLIAFTVEAVDTGETLFEISLPTWNNLAFTGLEIEEGTTLKNFTPESKKIYVAYGNSITHGVGQYGTHETYAYKVAEHFNWELYNVAVGGAKTSSAIAAMLRDDFPEIDYMTILIGFNDYNGEGVDTAKYKKRYSEVLNFIRSKHHYTKIFCIAQTYTKQDTSVRTGIPIEDFRKVVYNIVKSRQSRGDKNIYLIEGNRITDESNLKDIVHFSVEGAAAFADSLISVMETFLDSNVTGINNEKIGTNKTQGKSKIKFSVYPNPANGYINISSNTPAKEIVVYNLRGEIVKSFNNTSKIKLVGLSKGIYFLRYTNLKGLFKTEKIILN
jgi:lysophospholipase L1-like esterase